MHLTLNIHMPYGIVKEKQYFDKIYQRFNFQDEKTQEKIDEIYNITKKYLEEG